MSEDVKALTFDLDASPTLAQAWYCDKRIIGVMGPVNSGKSSYGVQQILKWGYMQKPMSDGVRRSKWAIVRATYEDLRKTTLETVEYWAGKIGHYNSNEKTFYINFTHPQFGKYEIELLFMGLERPEDKEKIGSLEVTGAMTEETRQLPEVIINTLKQRINRFPPKQEGGATRPGLVMITNPPPDRHWWYDYAEKKVHNDPEVAKYFKFFKQPGAFNYTINEDGSFNILGLNPLRENMKGIADDYYQLTLAGADEDTIRTQLLGLYGKTVAGCPVYTEYSDTKHFNANIKFQRGMPVWRAWDFGRRPCCIFAQVDVRGHINIFFELTSKNTGITAFSDRVIAYCRGNFPPGQEFFDVGDPAGEFQGQIDDNTPFLVMQNKGINIVPGLSNDPGVRIEAVRRGLTIHLDGRPIIQIGPGADLVREGFQGGYRYEQIKAGELAGEYRPRPVKDFYSDPQDAVQYLAMAILGDQVMGSSGNTGGAGTVGGGGGHDYTDIPGTREPDSDGFYF